MFDYKSRVEKVNRSECTASATINDPNKTLSRHGTITFDKDFLVIGNKEINGIKETIIAGEIGLITDILKASQYLRETAFDLLQKSGPTSEALEAVQFIMDELKEYNRRG